MTTYGEYLAQAVAGRVLVVGDSNTVFDARQLVEASQHYGAATGSVLLLEFGACVPGIGLRDLAALESRIDACQPASYDAAVVNLGVGDLILEDANWPGFFAGPPSYATRIHDVLDALDPLPVYWIGAPSGLNSPPCHPWEIAGVDLTLAGFDEDYSAYASYAAPYGASARMHYCNPDTAIGTLSPRFLDGLHYAPAAATALYAAVFARIVADLG